MTHYQPPAPAPVRPPRPKRRGGALWGGLAVAILADAIIAVGLPNAVGQARPVVPVPSTAPATPGVNVPTASPTPLSPRITPGKDGEVKMTDALRQGLVMIRVTTPNGSGAGTGMILNAEGQILTNYHVVRSTSDISITIANTKQRYEAKLLGRDAKRDVALLQLQQASGLETITVDTDGIEVGETAIAAGNASGQGYISAFAGEVTALDQSIRVRGQTEYDPDENLSGLIETDAHAEPGDSGGAMMDDYGVVVGMTTAGSNPSGGAQSSYAVPIATALAVVEQVRRGDESGSVVIGPKPYLGVVAKLSSSTSGVEVQDVESDSAAGEAGVKAGDVITALDDIDIDTRATLSTVLDTLEPGATVTISWTTGSGEEKTAEVTLGTSTLN